MVGREGENQYHFCRPSEGQKPGPKVLKLTVREGGIFTVEKAQDHLDHTLRFMNTQGELECKRRSHTPYREVKRDEKKVYFSLFSRYRTLKCEVRYH